MKKKEESKKRRGAPPKPIEEKLVSVSIALEPEQVVYVTEAYGGLSKGIRHIISAHRKIK